MTSSKVDEVWARLKAAQAPARPKLPPAAAAAASAPAAAAALFLFPRGPLAYLGLQTSNLEG